eukprot:351971-Chlamydomonas_euryale.AAC.3
MRSAGKFHRLAIGCKAASASQSRVSSGAPTPKISRAVLKRGLLFCPGRATHQFAGPTPTATSAATTATSFPYEQRTAPRPSCGRKAYSSAILSYATAIAPT